MKCSAYSNQLGMELMSPCQNAAVCKAPGQNRCSTFYPFRNSVSCNLYYATERNCVMLWSYHTCCGGRNPSTPVPVRTRRRKELTEPFLTPPKEDAPRPRTDRRGSDRRQDRPPSPGENRTLTPFLHGSRSQSMILVFPAPFLSHNPDILSMLSGLSSKSLRWISS
jgi:hypothetical protein